MSERHGQSPPDGGLPAHERVYRSLRARIMHGLIAPGVSMTLRGIAAEFDVSTTPAREAVRRLVAEGALKLSASGRVSTQETRLCLPSSRKPRCQSGLAR